MWLSCRQHLIGTMSSNAATPESLAVAVLCAVSLGVLPYYSLEP